jgi:hypothetical protein
MYDIVQYGQVGNTFYSYHLILYTILQAIPTLPYCTLTYILFLPFDTVHYLTVYPYLSILNIIIRVEIECEIVYSMEE